ncbi:MAG: prepilin peptidase, partial [Candidatus Eremiobacteraeota bacterium]|nr:prepilin peptidase [Candidatus Eremiobacteraeota bacterium]
MSAVYAAATMLAFAFLLCRVAHDASVTRGVALASPGTWPIAAAMIGLAVWFEAGTPAALAATGICVAALVDARCGYIFDPLVALAAGAAVLATFPSPPIGALAGIGATTLSLYLVRQVAGEHALGLGDVKLAAVVGAGLGPWLGLAALGTGFILGAAAGIALMAMHRARSKDRLR